MVNAVYNSLVTVDPPALIPMFLKFRIPNNSCFELTSIHNFKIRLLKKELLKAKQEAGNYLNVCIIDPQIV